MSLMQALKEETSKLHESIENNPFAIRLFSNRIDKAFYAKTLGAFYGFHAPLEEALNQHSAIKAIYQTRIPDLEQDLEALGSDVGTLPLCQNLPKTDSLSCALGVLYVLEGSRMGGQMIAGKLRENTQETWPVRFFLGLGSQTMPYWKDLAVQIESLAEKEDQNQITHEACETFRSLEEWLNHVL